MIAFALSLLAAAAPNYFRVAESTSAIVYADKATVVPVSGDIKSMSVTMVMRDPDRGAKAVVFQAQFNCAAEKYNIVSQTIITPDMKSLPTSNFAAEWKNADDSVVSRAKYVACGPNFFREISTDPFTDAAARFATR